MNQPVLTRNQTSGKSVVYLRVSTEDQVENYSLDTQESICKKEAEKRGTEILKTFREEGKSAKTISGRPALLEMLAFCQKNKKVVDMIIVYRLDRVSRQTADYLAIRKKLAECEIKLVSATEPTGNSPTEKFVETMLAGFAQMDNDVRGERSKNGMRARLMAGLSNGYVPLGYLNQSGYATKDPATFEKIEAAWKLFGGGKKTLREMAVIMAKQGIKGGNRNGKETVLYPQMLNRIFRNKFYTGKVVSKKYGIEVQGQHAPMITEELFYKVQAILDGRNTNIAIPLARKNRDNADFPLRRIVKCNKCGASITGGWSKGRNKHYAYYFCPKGCKGSTVAVGKLETFMIGLIEKVALKPNAIELLIAYLRRKYFERIASLQKRREQADSELKKLYGFRQALIEKNLSGIYSDEIFKEQNKMIEEKVKDIQYTKNDELIEKYNLEAIIIFIRRKLSNLPETYTNSDLGQKRVLLGSIFSSGLVYSENTYLNPSINRYYIALSDLSEPCVRFGSGGWI